MSYCKPGDLARVVKKGDANYGAIVIVQEKDEVLTADTGALYWRVHPLQSITVRYKGETVRWVPGVTKHMGCSAPDHFLRPIPPLEDPSTVERPLLEPAV